MHEYRETSKIPAVETVSRSAGEGLGRRLHVVSEESGRGVRSRNDWNKDGMPSAEDEEGRLRITNGNRLVARVISQRFAPAGKLGYT